MVWNRIVAQAGTRAPQYARHVWAITNKTTGAWFVGFENGGPSWVPAEQRALARRMSADTAARYLDFIATDWPALNLGAVEVPATE